eukprot:365795-Prymnesium_polylepis.1
MVGKAGSSTSSPSTAARMLLRNVRYVNVRSSDGSSWEPEWLHADVLIDLDDDGAPALPPA